MVSIEFDQVSFRYPPTAAREPPSWLLQDFSLTFARPGITVVLGASGSGKSTLLNLIANLSRPEKGVVAIRGITHPRAWPPVGMVFQTSALLPWRTVLGNAVFGAEMSGHSAKPEVYQSAESLLTRHGLADYLHRYPRELSQGMQQRLSVVRAMVAGAGVLLLDEPFSSLDFLNRRSLQQEVAAMVARSGVLAILVTHDLDDAFRLGDEVLVIGQRPLRVLDRFDLPGSREERLSATHLQMRPYEERIWRCWEPQHKNPTEEG